MHFGRLTVHFVKKHRRSCTNLSCNTRKPTEDCTSQLSAASVPVPLEHAVTVLVSSVTDVQSVVHDGRRETNSTKKRALLPAADNLNVVLHQAGRRIEKVARQLACRCRENQRDDFAFDGTLRRQRRRRHPLPMRGFCLCRGNRRRGLRLCRVNRWGGLRLCCGNRTGGSRCWRTLRQR